MLYICGYLFSTHVKYIVCLAAAFGLAAFPGLAAADVEGAMIFEGFEDVELREVFLPLGTDEPLEVEGVLSDADTDEELAVADEGDVYEKGGLFFLHFDLDEEPLLIDRDEATLFWELDGDRAVDYASEYADEIALEMHDLVSGDDITESDLDIERDREELFVTRLGWEEEDIYEDDEDEDEYNIVGHSSGDSTYIYLLGTKDAELLEMRFLFGGDARGVRGTLFDSAGNVVDTTNEVSSDAKRFLDFRVGQEGINQYRLHVDTENGIEPRFFWEETAVIFRNVFTGEDIPSTEVRAYTSLGDLIINVGNADARPLESREFAEVSASLTIPDDAIPPPAGFEDDIQVSQQTSAFPDAPDTTLVGRAATYLYNNAIIGGFPDGNFYGDRDVSRAGALKFLLYARYPGEKEDIQTQRNNGKFWDVLESEWYVPFVVHAANLGIVNGYADGRFDPGGTVTTAEFCKMLTIAFGLQEGLPHNFVDTNGHWGDQFVGVAAAYNLFPNRGLAIFPDARLSREDVAVAIYQFLGGISAGGAVSGS